MALDTTPATRKTKPSIGTFTTPKKNTTPLATDGALHKPTLTHDIDELEHIILQAHKNSVPAVKASDGEAEKAGVAITVDDPEYG